MEVTIKLKSKNIDYLLEQLDTIKMQLKSRPVEDFSKPFFALYQVATKDEAHIIYIENRE